MPNWQKDAELRLLRELTFYYMLRQADGMNVTQLLKGISRHLPDKERQEVESSSRSSAYDTLERFLHFEHLHPRRDKTAVHEALFRHVVGWFLENQRDPKVSKSEFLHKIKEKGRDWFAALDQPAPPDRSF